MEEVSVYRRVAFQPVRMAAEVYLREYIVKFKPQFTFEDLSVTLREVLDKCEYGYFSPKNARYLVALAIDRFIQRHHDFRYIPHGALERQLGISWNYTKKWGRKLGYFMK